MSRKIILIPRESYTNTVEPPHPELKSNPRLKIPIDVYSFPADRAVFHSCFYYDKLRAMCAFQDTMLLADKDIMQGACLQPWLLWGLLAAAQMRCRKCCALVAYL